MTTFLEPKITFLHIKKIGGILYYGELDENSLV